MDHVPTEMEVAQQIVSGILPSPQKYENVSLFAMRITGTGTSYRPALGEIVYRPPENYLTPEFMARCNGLPVVIDHPNKPMLDSEEFGNRVIGTIVMPYLKADEVWGIAKIYDAAAADEMAAGKLSTSPGVVFRNAEENQTADIDGKTVLIEGKPSYLDHLAVCESGVWDKGGEPSGVDSTGAIMTDTTEPAGATRSDSASLDAVFARLDSMFAPLVSRLDALEAKKDADKDPEAKKDADCDPDAKKDFDKDAPESKKDADDDKEDDKDDDKKDERKDADDDDRADAARMDAVERRVSAFEKMIPRQMTDAERDEVAAAFARADSVYQMAGKKAPYAMDGETPIAYRRRLVRGLQSQSPAYKDVRLDTASADPALFSIIENGIYADAEKNARAPDDVPLMTLRPIVRTDAAGRRITEFTGDPLAWMSRFMPAVRMRQPAQWHTAAQRTNRSNAQ